MFERRAQYYYGLASRLRHMAEETRFAEIRTSYLKLAHQFERLAESAERSGNAEGYALSASEDD